MDTFEYNLNEEEEKSPNPNKKWPFKAKLTIVVLIVIIILLIIGIILLILLKKAKSKNEEIPDYSYYTIKYTNLSYTDNTIINSFKKNGIHYNATMGEINDGNDYLKTDRNNYDLYIPYIPKNKKNEYNQVLLLLHSGGWKEGSKAEMNIFCDLFINQGYITANMGYTLINEDYKNYNPNIFRLLDEITTCIQNIKDVLKKEGFNIDKLELAIGGASAGGHLSLLYSYSMKNSPIPIKFIMDVSGPVTLDPEHFWKVKNQDEPLNSIEKNEIEIAKNESKIDYLFENDKKILQYMNSFYGNKFTDDDLNEMLENGRLNKNNENYKKMFNVIINGYPTHFVNSNSIPALCVYGGKDELLGIDQYSHLKSINSEYGKKLKLLYSKNGYHNVFQINGGPNIELLEEILTQIKEFSKLYFTSYNR